MAEAKSTALTFKDSLALTLEQEKTSLPVDFDTQRFARNAVYALTHNEQLIKFNNQYGAKAQIQIKEALMQAAYLGLDLGVADDFYLIAYGDQLRFSPSPSGTTKIIRKYAPKPVKRGPVAELIYEGEHFQKKYLDDGTLWFDRTFLPEEEKVGKKIIGGVAWLIYEDGDRIFEYQTIDQLNVSRAKSKMANNGVWKDAPEKMYSKTLLHRLRRVMGIEFGTPNQKEAFDDDMAIETEPIEIRNNAIEQNANSVDFEEVQDAEVKPVPVEEVEKMVTPFQ